MDPRTRMIVEIDTIHELLGELDYYRVLQLSPDAEQAAVGTAFRQESRRLHPDRLAALRDPDAQAKANDIYRLVNEAYRTLKDPEQRAQYDEVLAQGGLRMTDEAAAQAQADKGSDDPENAASDPRAEKYWKMALRDFSSENFKACVMNIKFAMSFEQGNDVFAEWLEKAEQALEEQEAQAEQNPYKLRIM